MTEQRTADLVEWLTKVWDEEERVAKSGDWGIRSGSELWVQTISSPGIAPGICASPQYVLARIAADRKILELHGPGDHYPEDCGICNEMLPCETVRLLASPYKGRGGWRESWDHE